MTEINISALPEADQGAFASALAAAPLLVIAKLRPQSAAFLYSGKARYDFDREPVDAEEGSLALIYERTPEKLVSGYFTIGETIQGSAESLAALEEDEVIRTISSAALEGAAHPSAVQVREPVRFSEPVALAALVELEQAPENYEVLA